jgi:hypothetical protein
MGGLGGGGGGGYDRIQRYDRGTQGACGQARARHSSMSEGCSPVSGGRTIRLRSSWPSDGSPTPLRSSVDSGAGDRSGASAEFAVVAETVGSREDVGAVVLM